MKIASITDDGKTISQHFGRAPYYLVMTLEEGKEVAREMRSKLGHNQFSAESGHKEHSHEHSTEQHGNHADGHSKHVRMAEAIADCEVLLCGGMGWGAYQSMQALNIRPLVTEIMDIDQAVQAYLNGKIVDRIDLLH